MNTQPADEISSHVCRQRTDGKRKASIFGVRVPMLRSKLAQTFVARGVLLMQCVSYGSEGSSTNSPLLSCTIVSFVLFASTVYQEEIDADLKQPSPAQMRVRQPYSSHHRDTEQKGGKKWQLHNITCTTSAFARENACTATLQYSPWRFRAKRR